MWGIELELYNGKNREFQTQQLIKLVLPTLQYTTDRFISIARYIMENKKLYSPDLRNQIAQTAIELFKHTHHCRTLRSHVNQAWAIKLIQLCITEERRHFLQSLLTASTPPLIRYTIQKG